jgi:hypothetical protein
VLTKGVHTGNRALESRASVPRRTLWVNKIEGLIGGKQALSENLKSCSKWLTDYQNYQRADCKNIYI